MPFKKICGVYLITNWKTGAHYVGAAQHVLIRWCVHRLELRERRHIYQRHFGSALKSGDLSFFTLQECTRTMSKAELLQLEQEWMNNFPHRINIHKNAAGKGDPGRPWTEQERCSAGLRRKGKKHSTATKEKISRAHLGKKFTPAHIENNRLAHLGIKLGPFSEAHKDKIRQALKGRKKSPEHIANLRLAQQKRHAKTK